MFICFVQERERERERHAHTKRGEIEHVLHEITSHKIIRKRREREREREYLLNSC